MICAASVSNLAKSITEGCPVERPMSQKLLVMCIYVKNKKLRMLIDNGASMSFISPVAVSLLETPLFTNGSEIKIGLADGLQHIQNHMWTDELKLFPMKNSKIYIEVKFTLFKQMADRIDMILGLPDITRLNLQHMKGNEISIDVCGGKSQRLTCSCIANDNDDVPISFITAECMNLMAQSSNIEEAYIVKLDVENTYNDTDSVEFEKPSVVCDRYSDVIEEFKGLFPTKDIFVDDVAGRDLVSVEVDETLYSAKKQFPLDSVKFKALKQHVKKLLEQGVIQPATKDSEMFNSACLKYDANKNIKAFRLCLDLKNLNIACPEIQSFIPDIRTTLHELGKAVVFTSTDIRSAFHNLLVKPEHRKYFTFTVGTKKFHYARLPFGWNNSPSKFSNYINGILHEHIEAGYLKVYVDDCLIASKTHEEHRVHLRAVLQTLKMNQLYLNPKKTFVGVQEVKFVGYIVSKDSIRVDPVKIQSLMKMPKPNSVKEVRILLGMANYNRQHIIDFATIVKPLNKLTGSKKFNWDKEHDIAFEKLKKAMIRACSLTIPDYEDNFSLVCDASEIGFSCLLYQKKGLIGCYSKAWSDSQLSNTQMQINKYEILAIVYGIKYFEKYLKV